MNSSIEKSLRLIIFLICVDLIATGLWVKQSVDTFHGDASRAPIAVVLIHDFDQETGAPGPETQRRLNYVLRLYQDEKIEYVLCVGGARPRFDVFGSVLMRQFLIQAGIPKGRVFSEKKSFDSKTNWYMAYKIVKNYGWRTIMVVSSPFHLYRFRQIIKDGPKNHLKVFFAPYSLKNAHPPITYLDIWRQVHYEWLAHLSKFLPEAIYRRLIRHSRGQ